MASDIAFTLMHEQDEYVYFEIHVIPSALRREALAMTSSRLVDVHAVECTYTLMKLRQLLFHIVQKPFEAYKSYHMRRMGFAWPYKRYIHPLIGKTAEQLYARVVIEFLPLRIIYDPSYLDRV